MSEKGSVTVKLDYHVARKTDAQTYWKAKLDGKSKALSEVGKRLLTTESSQKTHWEEYWSVPADVKLVRIRISNRGNLHVEEVPVSAVAISPQEEEALMAALGS
jgi:hypothetical protein